MQNKTLLLVFALLFVSSLSVISAGGLVIVGDNNFKINKTVGGDEFIHLQLRNDESFSFYNVSIEDNTYLDFPEISELSPGQQTNISIKVLTNDEVSLDFVIKGMYEANLGITNETYDINIHYDTGISYDECYRTIVKGDKINWINHVMDTVDIYNIDTSSKHISILEGESRIELFSSPLVLEYVVNRRSFPITTNCRLTVIDDSGYVNDPEQDATFRIEVTPIYDPTTISVLFTETSYSLNLSEEREGVFTITNTGNKIAKAVSIGAEWMKFSYNNFDLAPGQTKGIIYTIKPYVVSSNDTNMSYTKNITINGNFNSVSQAIDIFLEYTDVWDGVSNYSGNSLDELFNVWCEANPNVCNPQPTIVYRNPENQTFNVSHSEAQVKGIYEYIFESGDDDAIKNNKMVEFLAGLNMTVEDLRNELLNMSDDLKEVKSANQESDSFVLFIVLGIAIIIIVPAGGYFLYKLRKEIKKKELSRY